MIYVPGVSDNNVAALIGSTLELNTLTLRIDNVRQCSALIRYNSQLRMDRTETVNMSRVSRNSSREIKSNNSQLELVRQR